MYDLFRCLHYNQYNEKLQLHSVDCTKMNDCAIRLPSEDDKWLSFNNHCKERVSFVIYTDLECALEKMERNLNKSTHTYQQHKVFSIGYYAHCSYDSLSKYHFRCGNDCIAWFVEELRNLTHKVNTILSTMLPWQILRETIGKNLTAPHTVMCAKNRSCLTTHRYAIIAI